MSGEIVVDLGFIIRDALIRACWQGGIAIAVVWILCRIVPGISPGLKCWMWRLAYLKLLIALFWVTPIDLPLLPPDPVVANSGNRVLQLDFEQYSFSPKGLASVPSRQFPWVLTAWLAGICWCVLRIAGDVRSARELASGCAPCKDARVCSFLNELTVDLNLVRVPSLLISRGEEGPVLIGASQPAIVLPERLLKDCNDAELRLMLAHELAHIKRADLRWNRVPAISHALFHFHPFVYLGNHEWRLAQEMACDEIALRVTGMAPANYGEALMKVASRNERCVIAGFSAASFDESPSALKRRLKAMQTYRVTSKRKLVAAGVLLAIGGVAAVIPWRVVAQTPQTKTANSASKAASSKNDSSEQKAILERLKSLEAQVRALNAKLADQRSRASADRKREEQFVMRARESDLKAQMASRKVQEIQMHVERARLEQFMQRERAVKEDELARQRAMSDAERQADVKRLHEQLDVQKERAESERKRGEELYRKGLLSQSDHEKMLREHEDTARKLQYDIEKIKAVHEAEQKRFGVEHFRMLEVERAKLHQNAAEQQRFLAEQEALKVKVRQQEEHIRELEKKLQEKKKGEGSDLRSKLEYDVQVAYAQLLAARAKYGDAHPEIQSLRSRLYVAQASLAASSPTRPHDPRSKQ